MKKLILSIIMTLLLTGAASALEIQVTPKVSLFSESVGFEVYQNIRYDLGNHWEQASGLKTGVSVGYSQVNIEENTARYLHLGGLISYNYYFIDELHTRISVLNGAKISLGDESYTDFMLLPSFELGYEVIDNVTVGSTIGLRIAFHEIQEISLPFGAFISYSF